MRAGVVEIMSPLEERPRRYGFASPLLHAFFLARLSFGTPEAIVEAIERTPSKRHLRQERARTDGLV